MVRIDISGTPPKTIIEMITWCNDTFGRPDDVIWGFQDLQFITLHEKYYTLYLLRWGS